MGSENQFVTDFLFPQADYILGAGSVLGLDGSYFKYNFSPTGEEADYAAIKSDWGVVGQDLKKAISSVEKSDGRTIR
jgi:hypothetical protein